MDGELTVRHGEHGSEWVIVRPTSVWGPWFIHSYKKFFQMVSRGLYAHIQKAADITKPITYVGNAAYMMESLLTAPGNHVASQTFYLGDYPECTVRQWAEAVRRETGARWIPTVPYGVLKVAALVGDGFKKLGWHAFRSRHSASAISSPDALSHRKDQGRRWALPYTLAEGVRETVSWMCDHGFLPARRR